MLHEQRRAGDAFSRTYVPLAEPVLAQCLMNTAPLCEFFLKDAYKEQINENNPLGMKGRVANAFADLARVWYPAMQCEARSLNARARRRCGKVMFRPWRHVSLSTSLDNSHRALWAGVSRTQAYVSLRLGAAVD